MTEITKGRGTLGRIYDRLRKRSQRKLYSRSIDDSLSALLGQIAHDHYVAGVKDALQAVEQSGQYQCASCGWMIRQGADDES